MEFSTCELNGITCTSAVCLMRLLKFKKKFTTQEIRLLKNDSTILKIT